MFRFPVWGIITLAPMTITTNVYLFTRCMLNNAASPSSGKADISRGFHIAPSSVQVWRRVLLTDVLRESFLTCGRLLIGISFVSCRSTPR